MVERWFTRNPLHYFLKKYLEHKGFSVHFLRFSLTNGNFAQSARYLKGYIDSKELKDVVLVGISSGGLTCYHYLTDCGGWDKTKLFIGVGTPFKGSILSFMLFGFEIKKELDPHGTYIQSVLRKPVKNAQKIYSIMAVSDQMVGHDNSYLPGSKKIVIDVVGHNLLHTIWVPTMKKIAELSENSTDF